MTALELPNANPVQSFFSARLAKGSTNFSVTAEELSNALEELGHSYAEAID